MPEAGNPFKPGQPVHSPALFFGRRTAVTWIRDGLVRGRRLLLISGAPRIGKSSLLHQVGPHLPDTYAPVYVMLAGEEPGSLDWALWRLTDLLVQELNSQLHTALSRPDWTGFEGHPNYLLDAFWPNVRTALGGVRLLLMLDDIDHLVGPDSAPAASILAVLRTWTDRDPALALIPTLTIDAENIETARQTLGIPLADLPVHLLGPLGGEDAARLMTDPVEDVLTYDYGVVRRLVEITSGQPYYLHLLGFELFNRCVEGGWVNQRDVDLVVEKLVGREIAEFRQVWDTSSPHEQAVLAALVSLRVSRGVAGSLEVHTLLVNAGAKVEREQVAGVLAGLAKRGVLERLGVSYRFRVSLLADWLRERVDLPRLAHDTRWVKERDRDRPPPDNSRTARPQPERNHAFPISRLPRPEERVEGVIAGGDSRTGDLAASPVPAAPALARRLRSRWFWLAPAAVFGVGLVVILSLGWLVPPRDGAGPTARPSAVVPGSATPRVGVTVTDHAVVAGTSDTPSPVYTETPTPRVVVSRPIPAIAYQSRPKGEDVWSIYVMDSDGGHPQRLTDGKVKSITPAWSGDGSQIAYVSYQDGNPDIWVMRADGSGQINLTRHAAQDQWPAWSPSVAAGQGLGEVAFASVRDTVYWELYVMRADGSDVRRLTWWNDASDLGPAWSPDGSRIVFTSKRDGNWEIYAIDRDGRNLVRLTFDPADDTNPSWSPDGARIAFESTRSGYADVFVMPAAGGSATNLTNQRFASDHGPTWSPDGSRIAFFSDRDGEWDIYVMAADGSSVVKLTGEDTEDQVPAWRP